MGTKGEKYLVDSSKTIYNQTILHFYSQYRENGSNFSSENFFSPSKLVITLKRNGVVRWLSITNTNANPRKRSKLQTGSR